MELPFAEAWKIKMVEPIKKSTREQREQWLKEAHNNVFMLKSDYVYIDLLTDSGTGAMSDRQWAAMMQGDESYGGARSFYHMKDTITELTGFEYVIPTHQGRAAENVLFSYLVKPGMVVPGNAHFDTTKGHIESRKAFAIDVTVKEAYDTQLEVPFKGNVDLEKLEKILKENKGNVPFMVLTVTNNTVGGQPVSMQNIRETCELCHKYGVPVNVDSARFIENAYFIKTREKGYENKTLREISPGDVQLRRQHDHERQEGRPREHGRLHRHQQEGLVRGCQALLHPLRGLPHLRRYERPRHGRPGRGPEGEHRV